MKRSVGDLLIWAGVAAGVGGSVLLALGAWVTLPLAVVVLIAKALPFVVAAALLTLGAVVRRSALREAVARSSHPDGPADPRALGPGAMPDASRARGER